MSIDWTSLNAAVIEEFRANGGKVARFGDNPVVIVHAIGAKSGDVRETPLVVVLDADDLLLFGSNAGGARHPDWVFNLRAQPRVTVEYGTERFVADIVELDPARAREKVREQADAVPQFAAYVASAAPRSIPVFQVSRV